MEAIVLAGGLGTRLASRLNGVPKPMAPVAGRPFLEILLSKLQRSGCTRVILSVGYLGDVIRNHFGSDFAGMAIDYVVEDMPLGTGGAIRKALGAATEDSVLVLNGDTFLDMDYGAALSFHHQHGAAVTLTITPMDDIARYGEVITRNNRVIGFAEKGRAGQGWINGGVYVLSRTIPWPVELGEKFSFEMNFLAQEVAAYKLAAFAVNGLFLDIGVPEDLDRAQDLLAAV
jgi:D-glycero-alpha-D-manno-heptose 1-phosphate guanylyltransferase